jgi:hypothetical protein
MSKFPGDMGTMKRRYALALAGAVLFSALDFFYYPFLLFAGGIRHIHYIFYTPFLGAEQLLNWTRYAFGWPHSEHTFAEDFATFFLLLNWSCYAILGFFVGLTLGRHIWKEP